jgi:acyl carrier protein
MSLPISSRTPEGVPNHCPICDTLVCIEPTEPPGDAPCPGCGTLLWFIETSAGMRCYDAAAVAPLWERLLAILGENLGVTQQQVSSSTSFTRDVGADSLDLVELVMELEEDFDITIPDEEAEKIKTVGDAIDYIQRHFRK